MCVSEDCQNPLFKIKGPFKFKKKNFGKTNSLDSEKVQVSLKIFTKFKKYTVAHTNHCEITHSIELVESVFILERIRRRIGEGRILRRFEVAFIGVLVRIALGCATLGCMCFAARMMILC